MITFTFLYKFLVSLRCWISYVCITSSLSIFLVKMEFPLKFKHIRDCWFFFSLQWRQLSWNRHPPAVIWTGCSLGMLHSSHFEMPFIFILRIPSTPTPQPGVRFLYFLDSKQLPKKGCMGRKILRPCMSESIFISSLYLTDSLDGYRILGWN